MRRRLIEASLSRKATLVVKNARIANVFTKEIIHADAALYGDTIIGVGKGYDAPEVIDAEGAYLLPGLIDSHVHIESSMVTPARFAAAVMPHGTTTIIADPHEIANVAGVKGIRAMYEATEDNPLRTLFMLPSCVPATPFENAGARLLAEDMRELAGLERVIGLGEVMDVGSVTGAREEMLAKLRLFEGRPIDGHAPLLSGDGLNAYRLGGASTDHECVLYEEVLEKLRCGMGILIRVGSAANGIEELLERIAREKLPTDNMMFCTDDKHLENIVREGHINCIMALAVRCGIDPMDAVRMGGYNAARTYGLRDIGAIAPGFKGDMVIVEDLESFRVREVITRFGKRFDGSVQEYPGFDAALFDTVHLGSLDEGSLRLPAKERMPVIGLVEGQIVTKRLERSVERDAEGCFVCSGGLNKLAVIERHHNTGNIGVGILEGFNIKGGAIASSMAHDSHNLVVAGDNDRDMLLAAESLRECGGGFAVVKEGRLAARLALPLCGIMSSEPVEKVIAGQRELLDAALSIGVSGRSDPLTMLSFLALPVIPELRITDKGLFDSVKMEFV